MRPLQEINSNRLKSAPQMLQEIQSMIKAQEIKNLNSEFNENDMQRVKMHGNCEPNFRRQPRVLEAQENMNPRKYLSQQNSISELSAKRRTKSGTNRSSFNTLEQSTGEASIVQIVMSGQQKESHKLRTKSQENLNDDATSLQSGRRKPARRIIRAVEVAQTPIEEPAFITTLIDKFSIQNETTDIISEHSTQSIVDRHSCKEWFQLFQARQKDLKLNTNQELQLDRFITLINEQSAGKLVLKDQGLSLNSAKAIARIIQQLPNITTLDLCTNNVNFGLGYIVTAVKKQSIVCLKLRNNNIDGRRASQVLYDLVNNNPALAIIDLGNSDNIKNRNRIYDEGVTAIIKGIADSGISVVSELHLTAASITDKGLKSLSLLQSCQMDLQVLDLSNNDLGNNVSRCLSPVFKSLVSLNLSSTKMGRLGCLELANNITQGHSLKYLDLSSNNIEAEGFCQLVFQLKSSASLLTLNVSNNDLKQEHRQFSQLSQFLATNKSLTALKLNSCRLGPYQITHFSDGLAKTQSLQTLQLQDNNIDQQSMQRLCEALSKQQTIVDLDLQKCGVTSKSVAFLSQLLASKYKLKSLNLSHNGIEDDGTRDLLQGVQLNPYLVKFKMELNPSRIALVRDIENIVYQNQLKVGSSEVPLFKQQILQVQTQTAECLADCAFEPAIRDEIMLHLPSKAQALLAELTKPLSSLETQLSRAYLNKHAAKDSLYPEYQFKLDSLGAKNKRKLLKSLSQIHSFQVCDIINKVDAVLAKEQEDKTHVLQQYALLESQKEEILNQFKLKNSDILAQVEKCFDVKQEMDFEITMLNEQQIRAVQRGEAQLQEQRHKIEVIRLNHDKIRREIKELWAQRGLRDSERENAQAKIAAELDKVKQKESLAKIIHETYIKELERFKNQMADDKRKAHDQELLSKQQIELAHQKKLQMQRQEVTKRQKLIWASKPRSGAPVLHTSLRKEQRSTSPIKLQDNTAMSKVSLAKESPKKVTAFTTEGQRSPSQFKMTAVDLLKIKL